MSGIFRRNVGFIVFCILSIGILTGFVLLSQNSALAADNAPAVEPLQTEPAEAMTAAGSDNRGRFLIVSYLIPLFGLAGLAFTFWKSSWVARQDPGTPKMQRIVAEHF